MNAAKESLVPTQTGNLRHQTSLRPQHESEHVTISNAESNAMTFSLVHKQSDSLQCKVYWQGQEHRLCPTDKLETRTILSDIFSRTGYLDTHRGMLLSNRLSEMITDTEFAYFRNISNC